MEKIWHKAIFCLCYLSTSSLINRKKNLLIMIFSCLEDDDNPLWSKKTNKKSISQLRLFWPVANIRKKFHPKQKWNNATFNQRVILISCLHLVFIKVVYDRPILGRRICKFCLVKVSTHLCYFKTNVWW